MPSMRYVMFSAPGDQAPRLGVLHGDAVVDLERLIGRSATVPHNLLALIDAGPAAWAAVAAAAGPALAAALPAGVAHPGSSVHLHAPLRPRKNVMCLGLNYKSHVAEGAKARGQELKLPEVPVVFTKAPTAVNGPYDDVPAHEGVTAQMDWEAEMGLVIGTGGTNIPRAEALSHVFGYTVINDITARDLQVSTAAARWVRAS